MTHDCAPGRGLVLSGGGWAGGAWMSGLLKGLRERGIDLGEADLIVGTSAGARTGAALAGGVLLQAVELMRQWRPSAKRPTATLDDFVRTAVRIHSETADQREAARRIANLEPLGEGLSSAGERRDAIASLLPPKGWPDQRLVITAVDAGSGDRVTFDAGSGVELLDAAVASAALPGIYPLASIDGRLYADGGVHSLYNADLAEDCERVVVLSPIPVDNEFLRAQLDREIASLGEAAAHLVTPDQASLAAIGPDPLSESTVPAALDAGMAQAEREAPGVGGAWTSDR